MISQTADAGRIPTQRTIPPIQTFLRVIVVSFVALILFAIPREGAVQPPLATRVIVGSGIGGQSKVRVFDGTTAAPLPGSLGSFTALTQNPGGEVRVAGCDFNNDGTDDIIASPGLGKRAEVRVFDGATGAPFPAPLGSFLAFESGFLGGVHLACGDLTGDSIPDIIAARGALAKPEVRVFNGAPTGPTVTLLRSFFAFEQKFLGGVRVAACDLNPQDGNVDIVAARGPLGQPEVRAFEGVSGTTPFLSFLAFAPSDRGGVYVACGGDLSGDTIPDIIAGKGLGKPPEVRVFNSVDATLLRSFHAFDPTFAGGVRVASCDLHQDGTTDIIAGRGPGAQPQVQAFEGVSGTTPFLSFLAFAPTFKGGVYVACSPNDSGGGGPPEIEKAPEVASTTPTNGATGVTTNSNLTITFDEDVAVGSDWFKVDCPTSGIRNVTNTVVTGGPTVFTIDPAPTPPTNPTGDFAPGELCTTTVFAAQITDLDTSDPPDNMADDFTFGFTTDAAPTVSSITPADVATDVAVNTNVTVNFSESVATTASTFGLECPAGTPPVAFTVNPGPDSVFTLDPNPDLPSGKLCAVTVTADQVTDSDANDPPDFMTANFTSTFTTVCSEVTVSPTTVAAGTAGQAYGPVTFTQTGGTGTITWSVSGALPAGMSLSTAGVLSGTPTQTGNFPVTVKATDSEGCTGEQAITLVINCPTITVSPASLPGGTIGSPYSQSVSQTGGVGTTTFAVTSGSLPSGLSLDSSSGAITGTPTGLGTFNFTITATDANGCTGVQAYSITIVCQPITVTPPAVNTGQMGVAFNQSFTQSGAFGTAVFSLGSGTLPTGLTLAANGTLSGTPTQSGSFPITVNVTDGNGCGGVSGTYTLVIRPNAVDDTYPQMVIGNVSIDSGLIPFSAITNDQFTGTPTISAFDATSVNGGTVTMVTSGGTIGRFTYNPPAGFEGTDTFTYTLSANGGTDTATVSFTVSSMVWFINNTAAACTIAGCGRLSNPYSTLAAFNATAADAQGDNIFLYESGTNYTGATALLDAQKLIGQDATATLAAITGLTPPSGSAQFPAMNSAAPVTTVASTVTLGTNITVRGLSIATTGAEGMNDPGVAISGVSVSEVAVSSTTAAGVSLSNLGGALSFRSVSASGGTNGILLNNTTGSFTVTGTGAAGTGGTIQNSLDSGIKATNVTGLSLSHLNVTNNGNGVTDDDEGIKLANLSGTASITNTSVTGSRHHNFFLDNSGGTLASLTITGSTFNSAVGGNGILFRAIGTAAVTSVSVTGSTFSDNQVTGMHVISEDTATVSLFTVSGNTFTDANAGDGLNQEIAMDFNTNDMGDLTFKALNNTLTGHNSHAMNIATGADVSGSTVGSSLNGRVTGNTIGTAAVAGSGSRIGNGIRVNMNGQSVNAILLDNNTIREAPVGRGIEIQGRNGTGQTDVTVTNNNVNHVNLTFDIANGSNFPLGAIVDLSNTAGTAGYTVRSDVRGNTVPAAGGALPPASEVTGTYLSLQELPPAGGSTHQLVDNPAGPGGQTATQQLQTSNTGDAGANAGVSLIAGPITTPP